MARAAAACYGADMAQYMTVAEAAWEAGGYQG